MTFTDIFRSDKEDVSEFVRWIDSRYSFQIAAMSQQLIEAFQVIRSHQKVIKELWMVFGLILLVVGYDATIKVLNHAASQAFIVTHTTMCIVFLIGMPIMLIWGSRKIIAIAKAEAQQKEEAFWQKYPDFDKEIRNQIYDAMTS